MTATYDLPELAVEDDVVQYRGRPVGVVEPDVLTLNLGWCRLAGLSVRVEDDPRLDHHRDGVLLNRPAPPRPTGPTAGASPA